MFRGSTPLAPTIGGSYNGFIMLGSNPRDVGSTPTPPAIYCVLCIMYIQYAMRGA